MEESVYEHPRSLRLVLNQPVPLGRFDLEPRVVCPTGGSGRNRRVSRPLRQSHINVLPDPPQRWHGPVRNAFSLHGLAMFTHHKSLPQEKRDLRAGFPTKPNDARLCPYDVR